MNWLFVCFIIFIIIACIQAFFYLYLFRTFAFSKPDKITKKNIAISVIVCAKNEAKNLKKFIPFIINQEYPDFEIILINDASSDNTLDVMEEFQQKHKNIKIVNVENNEAFWGKKKYALTLGIRASKNDFLLFTDADCKPVSKHWIKEMCSYFSNKKSLILGYGAYAKIKFSLLNKLIRFETLLTAIQYFSFAKIGIPYMGVGRNLAYRKDEFFLNNGFADHLDINSGDDDLFVNAVATKNNTTICYSKNSFTTSLPKTTFSSWIKQKRRHVTTANRYKFGFKFLLTLFYFSQIMFWLLSSYLLISTFKLYFVLAIFLAVLFIKYLAVGFSAKKLNELDTILLYPFLEIFLILIQFSIFITNLVSKPTHWK